MQIEQTILNVPIDAKRSLVLCRVTDAVTPFVTWVHDSSDDTYHLGHYYRDKEMAQNDFALRVLKRSLGV
jgi:hypothetical protein